MRLMTEARSRELENLYRLLREGGMLHPGMSLSSPDAAEVESVSGAVAVDVSAADAPATAVAVGSIDVVAPAAADAADVAASAAMEDAGDAGGVGGGDTVETGGAVDVAAAHVVDGGDTVYGAGAADGVSVVGETDVFDGADVARAGKITRAVRPAATAAADATAAAATAVAAGSIDVAASAVDALPATGAVASFASAPTAPAAQVAGGPSKPRLDEAPQSPPPVVVKDEEALARLLGEHPVKLQWLSSTRAGRVVIREQNGALLLTGRQGGGDDELLLDGYISTVRKGNFTFHGTLTTRIGFLNKGEPCVRTGRMWFVRKRGRPFWRLQSITNPCCGVSDYVDIYASPGASGR